MCLQIWGNFGEHRCLISVDAHTYNTGRVGEIKSNDILAHVCHCGSSLEESIESFIDYYSKMGLEYQIKDHLKS